MSVKTMPADTMLVHADGKWTLTFGRYQMVVKACACDLIPCTCRRKLVRSWARAGSHEQTHCHRGHAEHMAVLFRRAVRGTRR